MKKNKWEIITIILTVSFFIVLYSVDGKPLEIVNYLFIGLFFGISFGICILKLWNELIDLKRDKNVFKRKNL